MARLHSGGVISLAGLTLARDVTPPHAEKASEDKVLNERHIKIHTSSVAAPYIGLKMTRDYSCPVKLQLY